VLHVDEADRFLADLIDQEAVAGAEVAVQVLAAVGGDGDAHRAGHVAIGVGLDHREVGVLDALAPQQADRVLEGLGSTDVAALLGKVAGQDGAQILDGESLASVSGGSSFSSRAPTRALTSRPSRARAATSAMGGFAGGNRRFGHDGLQKRSSVERRASANPALYQGSALGRVPQAGLMQPDGQTSTHRGESLWPSHSVQVAASIL
jgi:hypothetical protein